MTLRLPVGLIGPDDTVYATLADLLPSVLAPMGVPGLRASPWRQLAPFERTVVLVVDGLGSDLLSEPGLDVPVLRSAHRTDDAIVAGFPTSTAVSITSIATGVRPGEHGIVGYTMAIPRPTSSSSASRGGPTTGTGGILPQSPSRS